MAVEKIVSTTSLVIDIENGVNSKGTTVYRKKTFSGVRTNVDPEKVYIVAKAISNVLEANIGNIYLKDSSQLIEN